MNWMTIVILVVVALILIAVDFYLPGFVLGSIGVGLMIVALVFSYKLYGLNGTIILFLIEAVLGISIGCLTIKYFPQTPLGRKMILAETQTGTHAQQSERLTDWVGREGVAQTVLRPAGVAMIDGKRLDVEAESGMIAAGSRIKIVAVHEHRLVVKKLS